MPLCYDSLNKTWFLQRPDLKPIEPPLRCGSRGLLWNGLVVCRLYGSVCQAPTETLQKPFPPWLQRLKRDLLVWLEDRVLLMFSTVPVGQRRSDLLPEDEASAAQTVQSRLIYRLSERNLRLLPPRVHVELDPETMRPLWISVNPAVIIAVRRPPPPPRSSNSACPHDVCNRRHIV